MRNGADAFEILGGEDPSNAGLIVVNTFNAMAYAKSDDAFAHPW